MTLIIDNKSTFYTPEVLLSFVTETKEGKFGTFSEPTTEVYHIDARREDLEEPVFYYSFR